MNRLDHSREAKAYTNPFPLTYSGVSLDKRPELLGIFCRGVEPARPLTIRVTANRDPKTEDQYERGNVLGELYQSIDMISFLAVVMSLFALIFSYDLVSGEKDRGTLRVALSFPVSRDAVLIGKWVGAYAAMSIPFVLMSLCCLATVAFSSEVDLPGEEVYAFGVLVLAGLLYIACFHSLGLMISAMTSKALTSITISLTIWMFTTIALPNLSPYIAQAIEPLPLVQAVERDKWQIGEEEMTIRRQRSREYRRTTTDVNPQRGVVLSEFWRDALANIARRQIQAESGS